MRAILIAHLEMGFSDGARGIPLACALAKRDKLF